MVMQEELIGQEKDKAGDEAKRAKLHQQWLEKQDEQELANLMDGVRNGFRRKRAGDLLLDDVRAPLTAFCSAALLLLTVAFYELSLRTRSSHTASHTPPTNTVWLLDDVQAPLSAHIHQQCLCSSCAAFG